MFCDGLECGELSEVTRKPGNALQRLGSRWICRYVSRAAVSHKGVRTVNSWPRRLYRDAHGDPRARARAFVTNRAVYMAWTCSASRFPFPDDCQQELVVKNGNDLGRTGSCVNEQPEKLIPFVGMK